MKRLPRLSYMEIELPYLPDNGKVGGNASHFNPQARGAALKKERKYWREALTVAGFPLNTEAIMVSPVQLNIIVQYPTSKRGPYPDIDNMATALKPLLDSMEIHRFTRLTSEVNGKTGALLESMKTTVMSGGNTSNTGGVINP